MCVRIVRYSRTLRRQRPSGWGLGSAETGLNDLVVNCRGEETGENGFNPGIHFQRSDSRWLTCAIAERSLSRPVKSVPIGCLLGIYTVGRLGLVRP